MPLQQDNNKDLKKEHRVECNFPNALALTMDRRLEEKKVVASNAEAQIIHRLGLSKHSVACLVLDSCVSLKLCLSV